jgi:hypothetical protein
MSLLSSQQTLIPLVAPNAAHSADVSANWYSSASSEKSVSTSAPVMPSGSPYRKAGVIISGLSSNAQNVLRSLSSGLNGL